MYIIQAIGRAAAKAGLSFLLIFEKTLLFVPAQRRNNRSRLGSSSTLIDLVVGFIQKKLLLVCKTNKEEKEL